MDRRYRRQRSKSDESATSSVGPSFSSASRTRQLMGKSLKLSRYVFDGSHVSVLGVPGDPGGSPLRLHSHDATEIKVHIRRDNIWIQSLLTKIETIEHVVGISVPIG
jgi:hypothetical protein